MVEVLGPGDSGPGMYSCVEMSRDEPWLKETGEPFEVSGVNLVAISGISEADRQQCNNLVVRATREFHGVVSHTRGPSLVPAHVRKVDEVAQIYQQALKLDPTGGTGALAWHGLDNCNHFVKCRTSPRVSYFARRFINMDKNKNRTVMGRLNYASALGDSGEVKAEGLQLLKLCEDYPTCLSLTTMLAECYRHQKRYLEAADALRWTVGKQLYEMTTLVPPNYAKFGMPTPREMDELAVLVRKVSADLWHLSNDSEDQGDDLYRQAGCQITRPAAMCYYRSLFFLEKGRVWLNDGDQASIVARNRLCTKLHWAMGWNGDGRTVAVGFQNVRGGPGLTTINQFSPEPDKDFQLLVCASCFTPSAGAGAEAGAEAAAGAGAGRARALVCGGCQCVSYCNAVCQRENWKAHKQRCNREKQKLAEAAAAAETAAAGAAAGAGAGAGAAEAGSGEGV